MQPKLLTTILYMHNVVGPYKHKSERFFDEY